MLRKELHPAGYLLIAFAFLLMVVGAAGAATLLLEPAGSEREVAKLLLAGHNVTPWSYINDRWFLKRYIEMRPSGPQAMVLGSSRAMQIRAPYFSGRTFFNFSVTGADLRDYIAIYGMAAQQGYRPEVVLLELNPWTLNGNTSAWKPLRYEYYAGRRRLALTGRDGGNDLLTELTTTLNTLPFFQYTYLFSLDSLKSSLLSAGRSKSLSVTNADTADVYVKRSDGSLGYPEKFLHLSDAELGELGRGYIEGLAKDDIDDHGVNFTKIDSVGERELRGFVKNLRLQGVQVAFLLVPYTAVVYDGLKRQEVFRNVDAVEGFYRKVAQENDVAVLGSYRPGTCPLNEFIDGIHPKSECLLRFFANQALGNTTPR